MGAAPEPAGSPDPGRSFLDSNEELTVIGGGELGGKALGLATIKGILAGACPPGTFPGVAIGIPRMAVVGTDVFARFMELNDLYPLALSGLPDERIAHAFLKAELPPLILGELRALLSEIRTPLAVRSSSLLEDALQHPFAGVYATKMIPNDHASLDVRFRKLAEAIKFVWSSTFFHDARQYMASIGERVEHERMAVVVQAVVGEKYDDRFYPVISGVVRTHNHYPVAPAAPPDGVVDLALGLGKTIVDGGLTWSYCPRYPRRGPPHAGTRDLLRGTQTRFWAVRLGPAPYDPVNEAEFLVENGLDVAEWDDVLRYTASTYDAASDRLVIGTANPGARVLTFAPLLEFEDVPLNALLRRVAAQCKAALEVDVEIEFAMTLDRRNGLPARFGMLQVRPMMVAGDIVDLDDEDLASDRVILSSESVLGNGVNDSLVDIVYVVPDSFEARHTTSVAAELMALNRKLVAEGRSYLLIGFGRWGSSDPWLGIPVRWPQISGAKVIVEATLPEMHVDASQGSHFFHNMISFRVQYFTVRHTSDQGIDWEWLAGQPAVAETKFLRHVRLASPLRVRVDGRRGRGVILRG